MYRKCFSLSNFNMNAKTTGATVFFVHQILPIISLELRELSWTIKTVEYSQLFCAYSLSAWRELCRICHSRPFKV